jgi:long-chain acyl-CoA synthetase
MNLNMGDALLRNARRFPRKPAIVDGRRSITYLDLHLRTNGLANYLLNEGISHGDRVALSCGNRIEHVEVIFALAKIGAIAVPFDYHWTVREWQMMMNFFEPKALVI